MKIFTCPTIGVQSVAWSSDGNHVAYGAGSLGRPGILLVSDSATGDNVWELKGHKDAITCVAWRKTDKLVSGSEDQTLIIWNIGTGEKIAQLIGHTGQVTSIAWSSTAEDLIVSAAGSYVNPGEVLLWNAITGAIVLQLKGHTGAVNSVAWSPCGRHIATASNDGTVALWDAASGARRAALAGRSGAFRALCVA